MLPEPVLTAVAVARIFDDLGIAYFVGGSMASSTYGSYRATQDVDFVAQLTRAHVAPLVAAMRDQFYIDAGTILHALDHESEFSILHLPTMIKVDVFLLSAEEWQQVELTRRVRVQLAVDDPRAWLYLASVEDMILQKLEWFRLGGGVSDRQWSDVQGMLTVRSGNLDYAYIRFWADKRNLRALLDRALDDSGLANRG